MEEVPDMKATKRTEITDAFLVATAFVLFCLHPVLGTAVILWWVVRA